MSLAKALTIEGWTKKHELAWLQEAAANSGPVIVEIGCWKARSTVAMASAVKAGTTIHTVDHFLGSPVERSDTYTADALKEDLHEIAKANLREFPNVVIFKMSSKKASEHFENGTVDMVFIDGGHSTYETLTDLQTWFPKLKPGGMLCGHDLDWDTVKEALRIFGKRYEKGAGNLWYFPPGQ